MRGFTRLVLAGFILTVAVLGLVLPLLFYVVHQMDSYENAIGRDYEALHAFDELRADRAEAEMRFLAFLQFAQPQARAAFESAASHMLEVWSGMQGLLPAPEASTAEYERVLRADLEAMRRIMRERESADRGATARLLEAERRGDELDTRVPALLEQLRAGQHEHLRALQRRREAALGVAWTASVVLVLALAAALGWLYRRIVRAQRQTDSTLASLRASEARFRSLSNLSADWYWEQDAQQRFSFQSVEADATGNLGSTSLGLTRRELPGIDLSSADFAAHELACSRREPFREFTYRRVSADGVGHWIRTSGEPVYDDKGEFRGYRGVGSDVTAQRGAEQEIVRLKDLYAALSQTNRAIVHIHDPEALFDEVCRVAVEYGHFCLAWIGLVDEATGWIRPIAIRGPVSEVYRRLRVSVNPEIPEGRGFAAAAVREGRYYIVNDFLAEPRVAPWVEQALAAGVRSLATFPLRRDGRCVGVLNLHGDEVGFFTGELVALLDEMADNISFALTNMQREAEREAAKRALAESEQKFRHLAANVPEVFWTADPESGRFTYVSPAYEKVFGRSGAALLERPSEWLDAVLDGDRAEAQVLQDRARRSPVDGEFRIVRPDGEVRWLHYRCFPVIGEDGLVTLVTGVAEDVTARKVDEQKLQHLAHYDNLTELPNRSLFYDRLQQTIVHARRERRLAAVVFIDVDHFKLVNDTLGHAAGDRLLQQVARRLEGAVRPGDTVGRLGGDEFALILSDLAAPDDAGRVAQKLMAALHDAFTIEGRELFVTASAGVTLYPDDGEEADALIKNADVAMYRAKEMGRNAYQFYRQEMNAHAVERMSMENHLRRALERGEFLLHYQPKIDIVNEGVSGMEALLRWQHPEAGQMPPARFVPILEDNGLIVPVGEWVLGEVCRQLKAWQEEGAFPVVPVAVNLSGRQLQQKGIARSLQGVISGSGVSPRLIELEITESVLMRNPEQTVGILRGLQEFGLRLSVDDFGTGYSSLGYLKSFPLDTLKIDRSFVRDIVSDPDDAMITRAVISMAHSLRMKAVAEGVETQAQLAMLAGAGCDEIQGYYFARPMSAGDCAAYVASYRRQLLADGTEEPTLLVVDDDAANAELISRELAHEGIRILVADCAERALELLATHHVSVILSDHRMPGMSGVELLRRVKGLAPQVVRVLMSGHMDLETATQAINQGEVYKVLVKTGAYDFLRTSIKEAFAYKALHDENRRLSGRVRALMAASRRRKAP
ncbi:MAG TPA: EAL domain-containing protein [Burkholderiales bacterium]|nr:EAL domain-containing protein [Burkholderiales bacterium]